MWHIRIYIRSIAIINYTIIATITTFIGGNIRRCNLNNVLFSSFLCRNGFFIFIISVWIRFYSRAILTKKLNSIA